LWISQLGTSDFEEAFSVSADGLGNVYISGYTTGHLDQPPAGGDDLFLSKLDGSGNVLWTRQFGTAAAERSQSISADGLGNVYASGYTVGNLVSPNLGFEDALVIKFSEIPEPLTGLHVLWASTLAVLFWRRAHELRGFGPEFSRCHQIMHSYGMSAVPENVNPQKKAAYQVGRGLAGNATGRVG
jgi:hypothetical protein